MRLFKIDNLDGIGDRTISVPTDSNFLIGVKRTEEFPTISMSKNGVALSALEDSVAGYTAFQETTGGSPYSQDYDVTLQGTKTIEVPKMGRALSVLMQASNGLYINFDLPIDDAAYWDTVNHPATVQGTKAIVRNPTTGAEVVAGVPTLTFTKVNSNKSINYKLTAGGYSVNLLFLLQFVDINTGTWTPFPEGFVPGWDNADQTLIGNASSTTTRTPYQGEKQIGTETIEVPVYRTFPIRLNCFASSVGYVG